MTSLSSQPSSWAANDSQRLHPRPLSNSSSTRPLSVASTISSQYSQSSLTGNRRRRSTALLELDLNSDCRDDTPSKRSIRNSILRAEEVLRASERQRELERRKERAGLRARQVNRSAQFIEHLEDDTTEELDVDDPDRYEAKASKKRFSPSRLLRKARSIPTELLLSPTPTRPSSTNGTHLVQNRYPEPSRIPPRPASSADILNPSSQSHPLLTPSDPATLSRSRYDTLPTRLDRLPLPVIEPTSKFSASSGDSIVHIVFDENDGGQAVRLKDRARSFSKASTSGFKAMGNRMKSKTPSKLNLRKKPSLAGIFRDPEPAGGGGDNDHSLKAPQPAQSRSTSKGSSRIPTFGHRQNESVSSSAPSTDQDIKRKEGGSRLGFFRSALRDSTNTASSGSRPRSSGTVSPSIISRPLSVSTGGGSSSDKRLSEVTSSSGTSSGNGEGKVSWATKLGRTIKGKNVAAKRALFESKSKRISPPIVQLAEKVKVGNPSPRNTTTRPPSRIPVTSLFTARVEPAPPVRPRRPSSGLISSDDTTFYGHRVPQVKKQAVAYDAVTSLASTAPRVKAKSSVPILKVRQNQTVDEKSQPLVPTFNSVRPRAIVDSRTRLPFSDLVLLPPAEIVPARFIPSRKLTLKKFERELVDPASPERPHSLLTPSPSSSDNDDLRCPSPARSFRSPSPARFRDLLPSGTASSPERNDQGLPMPVRQASPKSVSSKGSPRRRAALGPEQVICMTDARERTGPISEVRGATTDLADLLSGLEETRDYDRSRSIPSPRRPVLQPTVSPLPASLRQHLPHIESIESLRSTVSDVPDDLKDLINTVDDHISEVDIPSFSIEGFGLHERGFADEEFDSSSSDAETSEEDVEHFAAPFNPSLELLSVQQQHTNNGFSSDGATSTMGFDYTASSFEGHVSTAADVLRGMLNVGLPPLSTGPTFSELCELPDEESSEATTEESEDESGDSLRSSVREALDVGRPTAGEKMFDRVDFEVSLTALVDGPSLPSSPAQERSRPSIVAASFALGHLRHDSVISSSEGSSESTGFSLVNASPTPNPSSGRPLRHSLARYSQDRHPLNRPSHHARPQSSSSSEQGPSSNDSANLSLVASSRSTQLSISSITSSPCPVPRNRRVPMLTTHQRAPPLQPSFRFPPENDKAATIKAAQLSRMDVPLEEPEIESTTPPGISSSVEFPLREAKSSTSPRFVRPLRATRPGQAIPQPVLLEEDELESPLIPPDTPPPSSPSISGSDYTGLYVSSRHSQDEEDGYRSIPHNRETSTSSSMIQSIIVEEREDGRQEHYDSSAPPLSPIVEPPSPSQLPSFENAQEEQDFDESYEDVLDSEEDYDYTAQDPDVTRKFVHLNYEAETEIRRSRTIWPDTERSRDAVALFNAPKTYYAILDFLFASQNRFPSPPHLTRLSSFVPIAFADPPTPPSPVSPISPISPVEIPSPLHDSTGPFLSSTPPSPEPEPFSNFAPIEVVPLKPIQPLRKVLGNKSVNNALSNSTSSPMKEDALSPFTALPPRLGSKLRGLRAKVSPEKKKKVDTAFLGDAASRRRQTQFNAAQRKLEGAGSPSEQRSDEDTDSTGVLEAKGEATDEFTFSRTPPSATSRPRVRRRTVVSALR